MWCSCKYIYSESTFQRRIVAHPLGRYIKYQFNNQTRVWNGVESFAHCALTVTVGLTVVNKGSKRITVLPLDADEINLSFIYISFYPSFPHANITISRSACPRTVIQLNLTDKEEGLGLLHRVRSKRPFPKPPMKIWGWIWNTKRRCGHSASTKPRWVRIIIPISLWNTNWTVFDAVDEAELHLVEQTTPRPALTLPLNLPILIVP